MKRKSLLKRITAYTLATMLSLTFTLGSGYAKDTYAKSNSKEDEEIVLRVCNWEEYIDLGGWGEDELIELEDGTEILGENALYEDFETWYYEIYGKKVKVEYSCFGTNEDLYNMLNMGDEYDLVCPSDYMLMKLIAEDKVVPFSDEFFDTSDENNYYINGVSPYIKAAFEENKINGEPWSRYAAGYMWGVTGLLYNPEEVSAEDAKSWKLLENEKYKRRITIKDNVRDSYFSTLASEKRDLLVSEEFVNSPDYHERLAEEMNDVSIDTINKVQDRLQDIRENVYSFETDSGKADMVTGKVIANYQWSGDAVFAMNQAEEEDLYLSFSVPEECTDLWFDGWIMLKSGIDGDTEKQKAAEAFVNYCSMPEAAVRNMYYIGYTSCVAGTHYGSTVFDYLKYNYEAGEDEEDTIDYSVGLFFSGDAEDPDYVLTVPESQANRQVYAQYPTADVLNRSAIMQYFDAEANKNINQMWINVRCYNIRDVKPAVWITIGVIILLIAALIIKRRLDKKAYGL